MISTIYSAQHIYNSQSLYDNDSFRISKELIDNRLRFIDLIQFPLLLLEELRCIRVFWFLIYLLSNVWNSLPSDIQWHTLFWSQVIIIYCLNSVIFRNITFVSLWIILSSCYSSYYIRLKKQNHLLKNTCYAPLFR